MKPAIACSILAALGPLGAATLVEVDFSGTGPNQVGDFTSADAQFTVLNPVISSAEIDSVGGNNNTASWVYDGTGTAAANTDLFTVSTFGGPTRLDLALGLSAAGQSYTITSVEIDVRASNSSGTTWEFGYRRASDNATQLIGAQTISTQSGADPISTYSIDLSGQGLTADDSAATWVLGGTGELRFLFYEPTATGNDNLQIDAIRVIGVPEPSSTLLVATAGLLLVSRRKRA